MITRTVDGDTLYIGSDAERLAITPLVDGTLFLATDTLVRWVVYRQAWVLKADQLSPYDLVWIEANYWISPDPLYPEPLNPTLTNYAETVNIIGAIGGGTQDIDLELGNVVSATVDTAETTFTFSNPPVTGLSGSFTLFLTDGGSQTINWPASVAWEGGTEPTLTASGVDILTFTTIDGGTIWYGFTSGLDMQ